MNPLQHQQAEWDAESAPPSPPEPLALALPKGWPWALVIGFAALYFGEVLFAAWVRG